MKISRRALAFVLSSLTLAHNACSPDKADQNSEEQAEVEEVLSADLGKNPSNFQATENEADEGESSDGEPSSSPSQAPAGFAIKAIKTQGPGCPEESVATNISDDRKAFTVSFSQFAIELPAGEKRVRNSCRLTLKLDVPVGWQYSVASFNHRGFLALDEGIEAIHATRYFFKGRGKGGGFRHTEIGEIAKDFVYTDSVGILTSVFSREWSDCVGRRDFIIDTAIQLKNKNPRKFPNATGILSNDNADGEFRQYFGLTWRRCVN